MNQTTGFFCTAALMAGTISGVWSGYLREETPHDATPALPLYKNVALDTTHAGSVHSHMPHQQER